MVEYVGRAVTTEPTNTLQRLEALADRFIPPAILTRSPEDARRARFAIAAAWLAAGFFVVATVVQGPTNRPLLVLNALSALLCAAAPFAVRRLGRPEPICHLVLALSFIKYLWIVFYWRGAGLSGATVLLAQLPLIATFLVGIRAGAVWALVVTIASVGIGLLGRAGTIVDHLPAHQRLFNDHFALAISTAVLFSVAALYEWRRAAAQRHIYALESERQAAEVARVQAMTRARLAETERLASLGRIAAATAHEINNPLTAVLVNLELLAESMPPDLASDWSAALMDAIDSGERIRRIVRDMSLCSQTPSSTLGAIQVEDAIDLALKLALPHMRGRARVEKRLGDALPRAVADTPRLAQALLALLVNAAQAIPEGHASNHEIAIATRADGEHVLIEVSDTGHGIPPELIDKVREPFFTTRAIGEGTGLGLTVCDGIVQSFGGTFAIESQPGRTVVRLSLVAAPPVPTVEAPARARFAAADARLAILIVDDEELVTRTLVRMVAAHAVTVAAGAGEALARIERGEPFDVIFCDLMMPDLSGMDLYERLLASHAELAPRIVFMTGGAFTDRAQKFRESVPNLFIEKPLDLASVRAVINRHLESKSEPALRRIK